MSLSELCANIITTRGDKSEYHEKNVMEFLTAPWGLGLGTTPGIPALYPAQRFIIKFFYGMELDRSSNRDIIIKDQFNEEVLFRFNEWDYMMHLYNEGRLNRVFDGTSYPNMILACGRRGGKTTLTSCIISYEMYRLMNKYSPQEYYGIMPEDVIYMTSVSTSRETATELFNKVTGNLERCEFFRKYRTEPTKQWMHFRSQRDIDKYGRDGRQSVALRVAACNAKGLRGPGNILVALDEMAHFFADDKGGGGSKVDDGEESNNDRSDAAIFKAVTPSVAKFKNKDGRPDGRVIGISSPAGKNGKFYDLYETAMSEKTDDYFVMRAPTWELDSNLSSKYLHSKHSENPITFKSEFGAEFSDRLFGWIDDPEVVLQNVDKKMTYKTRSIVRVPHFMGVDVGLKNDGTAICIGHWAEEIFQGARNTYIEVDEAKVRYSDDEGEDFRLGFTPDDVANWIEEFTKKYYISKGLMDQYYQRAVLPILDRKGLKQFEYRHFTDGLNSQVYQTLLTTMISKEIRFPGNEGKTAPTEKAVPNTELIAEILTLQAEQKSKLVVDVHAPQRKGMHDDLSDALTRMVTLAMENRGKGAPATLTGAAAVASVRSMRLTRHSELMKAVAGRPSARFGQVMSRRGMSSMFGR